jgi:hypothetical protein
MLVEQSMCVLKDEALTRSREEVDQLLVDKYKLKEEMDEFKVCLLCK